MKSIIFSFIMLLLFLVSCFFAGSLPAQIPQHYNYNTTGNPNSFPFGVWGKQVQWLIRAGEFNQPSRIPFGKSITAVYFYMASTSVTEFWHLSISLGQTSLISLPGGQIYAGPLTTVYYRPVVTLSSFTSTWMGITLDIPFPYDTSLSLVIDVSQCDIIWTTTMWLNQTSLTGLRRCYNNFSYGNCYYVYSGQDNWVANCGVDVVSTPNCLYYWSTQNSGTTNSLYSVKAVSDMVGWAVGAGATIRRTTDRGINWTNGNPNPGVITGNIYAIEAINADTAWCTASTPSATFIYRTTNGGANWTQTFTQAGGFINAIHFQTATTGYAIGNPVGGRWTVRWARYGGATWDSTLLAYLPQNGNESGWNNSMIFIGAYAWFGTNNSRVYRAWNPICPWTFAPTPGLVNSMSLHFNSNILGLAGGEIMLRTTDGGFTWSSIGTVPGTGNIFGIEGTGTDFWYIRGNEIYRSSNSGDNWTHSYTAPDNLLDIDFAIVNGCPEGWAVGAGGTTVKMSNDSLIGVGNNNKQIPNTYKLEQNYPNPFNPLTKITFAIPDAGKVELKVYDVLGREIAVILNEFRQAGTYAVEFNASGFASGLYFYTMKSGNFTDTKKMLLLK